MDFYSFYKGYNFNAHDYLGSHVTENGIVFRTFAPDAVAVSLLINGKEILMKKTMMIISLKSLLIQLKSEIHMNTEFFTKIHLSPTTVTYTPFSLSYAQIINL